ncbi:MAG: hypothetical protein GY807_23520 [Gammaproteobacteria bacterium]|nr:hypothetical protein [Gammaproteobacteria bacterium]
MPAVICPQNLRIACRALNSGETGLKLTELAALLSAQYFAMSQLIGNATASVISALNTPVPIAGTWTLVDAENFMAGPAGTSRVVYTGTDQLTVLIDFTATFAVGTVPTGTNITIRVFKNGIDTTGETIVTLFSTVMRTVSLTWLERIERNDTLELYVENNTNLDDITLTNANFRIAA